MYRLFSSLSSVQPRGTTTRRRCRRHFVIVVVRPHPHRRSLTHRGRLIMSPASRSIPGSTTYPSLSPPRTPYHRMCGCGRWPGCWGWRRAAPYLPPTKWASLSRPPPRALPYAILPPTPPAVGEAARKRFAPPARYPSDEVLRGTAQGTLSRLGHCLVSWRTKWQHPIVFPDNSPNLRLTFIFLFFTWLFLLPFCLCLNHSNKYFG